MSNHKIHRSRSSHKSKEKKSARKKDSSFSNSSTNSFSDENKVKQEAFIEIPNNVFKSRILKVKYLTSNVTKSHIEEIFSTWGVLKSLNMPMKDSQHFGYAFLEYENEEIAAKVKDKMCYGQIDGQEIEVIFKI